MKNYLLLSLFVLSTLVLVAQDGIKMMQYEPSPEHPYGQLNPEAPAATADFASMIGTCDCKSLNRNPDGSWQDTLQMVWRFKYIMNGMAVQDEVWREGGMYAGSIRQYHPDSAKWVVSYFSSPGVSTTPGAWLGNREGDKIVLFQDQKAPNGMEGFSRLTFHEMSDTGYQWKGEWVSKDESVVWPFWVIFCKKRRD